MTARNISGYNINMSALTETATNESIATMVDRIVRQFQPLQIILFGSLARGEATLDSDVDLLVVLPKITNKREAAIEIRRALVDLPISKDIIVTTPDEIARKGKLIGNVLQPALKVGKVLYEQSVQNLSVGELERQHTEGYLSQPVHPGEFDVWESERGWGEK
jgi:predicted nucleotidyltransferase